jgi:hypothetical protein
VAGGSTPVWGGAFTLRIVASVLCSPGIGKEGGAERGASHVACHHASQNQLDEMEAGSFNVCSAFWRGDPKDLQLRWTLKHLDLILEETRHQPPSSWLNLIV